MKKLLIISLLACFCTGWSCLVRKDAGKSLRDLQHAAIPPSTPDSFSILPAPPMEQGDAREGYNYLTSGDAFSSGIPNAIYKLLHSLRNSGLSQLAGYTPFTLNDFVVFRNDHGTLTATPGCLYCHAERFNGELIMGLGNSYGNFQNNTAGYFKLAGVLVRVLYGKNSDEFKTSERAITALKILERKTQTEMQGPSVAQRIGEVLASHCDPVTLKFRADTTYFSLPAVVIPEDIPALWIAKKRTALTVNAMRQGSFLKHMMSAAVITLQDTVEARTVLNHMTDVWAYIRSLQPPKYPFPVNGQLAAQGKKIFVLMCSRCHGTYGDLPQYPNAIIEPAIIGTDSLMWKYFKKYPEATEWFNKSWFATSQPPAFLKPQPGYVAPPLDGVWITAPYLHNGSVPTIEAVLNSKERPKYWRRNFNEERYDYKRLGWKYKSLSKPRGRKTYNTDVPGYGNYGHNFGDHLTNAERSAVIEYLKTL